VKVISLGWGVQSYTLAAMVALGELEPVDAAVHADTHHEAWFTYVFARQNTGWLDECGVKVVTVQSDHQKGSSDKWGGVFIPAFTHNGKTAGMLRRQCTYVWKVAPIRRWMQENRNGEPVELWLGISTDEALRQKESDVQYITNRWPLIEKDMSRQDCIRWLEAHELPVPPKSSCTFCPYHGTAEWRRTREVWQDWSEATAVDDAIRKMRPPFELYVHPSRKPLKDVDFGTPEEHGQMRLWDEECAGICGV